MNLAPGAIVIAEIVRRLHQDRHTWPVGRTRLQTVGYFATAAGVPTGLEFTEGSYRPFAHALTPLLGRLVDDGVLAEARSGHMLAVGPGPTFDGARARYQHRIQEHEAEIERVADLLPGSTHRAARPPPACTSPLVRSPVRWVDAHPSGRYSTSTCIGNGDADRARTHRRRACHPVSGRVRLAGRDPKPRPAPSRGRPRRARLTSALGMSHAGRMWAVTEFPSLRAASVTEFPTPASGNSPV